MLSERGERLEALTRIGPVTVRDNSPAWSPDRAWVVFASSRGRDSLAQTSLWIVAAQANAQPRRLTFGPSVDTSPSWTPDGSAIVFSSERDGSFDLWRIAVTMNTRGIPRAASSPQQLTSGPEHDLHPSVSPDGQRIAFTRLRADRTGSSLWILDHDAPSKLTDGPVDVTPSWSPDGRMLAFAGLATGLSDEREDADLFVIAADGSGRRAVLREPVGDQTNPVWSADGRYLFCTSVYRLEDKPLLSSVTFVDLHETPRVLRALHSRVGVLSRMEPALDSASLDHMALRKNLAYKEAIERVLEAEAVGAGQL